MQNVGFRDLFPLPLLETTFNDVFLHRRGKNPLGAGQLKYVFTV